MAALPAAGIDYCAVSRTGAERVLRYQGRAASMILDVPAAAIASVLGGLVSGAVIAVPTSVGYGATDQRHAGQG